MATKVYTVEEIELQDGTVVTVKPLNIKRLRVFMDIVKDFDKVEDEAASIDLMVKACSLAVGADPQMREKAADTEWLEDNLDIPTMWKILEVAGGVKPNDPNLLAAMESAGRT